MPDWSFRRRREILEIEPVMEKLAAARLGQQLPDFLISQRRWRSGILHKISKAGGRAIF